MKYFPLLDYLETHDYIKTVHAQFYLREYAKSSVPTVINDLVRNAYIERIRVHGEPCLRLRMKTNPNTGWNTRVESLEKRFDRFDYWVQHYEMNEDCKELLVRIERLEKTLKQIMGEN